MKKDNILIQFDDDKKILKIKNNKYNYKEIKNVKTYNKIVSRLIDNEIKKAIINLFTGDSYNSDFPPHTQKEETIVSQLGIEIFFVNSSIKINLLENEKDEILLNTTQYYSYKNLLSFYIKELNKIIKNNAI